jgi:hypothetical protein
MVRGPTPLTSLRREGVALITSAKEPKCLIRALASGLVSPQRDSPVEDELEQFVIGQGGGAAGHEALAEPAAVAALFGLCGDVVKAPGPLRHASPLPARPGLSRRRRAGRGAQRATA